MINLKFHNEEVGEKAQTYYDIDIYKESSFGKNFVNMIKEAEGTYDNAGNDRALHGQNQ